jgi:MFS family permease
MPAGSGLARSRPGRPVEAGDAAPGVSGATGERRAPGGPGTPGDAGRAGGEPVTRRGPTAAAVAGAYVDLIAVGYLLYGVGAISPYLRVRLGLTDAETGLHSSALALGIIAAGLIADRLDRSRGPRLTHVAAIALMVVASVAIAWAPSWPVTLSASGVMGLGCGLMIAHVNRTLGSGGDGLGRVRLARANLLSMLGALAVPIVIAAGLGIGAGWQIVVMPALAILIVAAGYARREPRGVVAALVERARLPVGFWVAWTLVVLVVSIEFSIVFWGSTLVERRASLSLVEATIVGGAFFAGMILGRVVISREAAGSMDPRRLVRIGLVGALAGALLTWWSTSGLMSAAGLLLSGMGVAVLYPLTVSLALARSRGHASVAAARLTMASGAAILLAPFILGALSDRAGVVAGWVLVPALCLASLALTAAVSPPDRSVASPIGAPDPAAGAAGVADPSARA